MDKNVRNDEQVTTVKRQWRTPILRKHGTITERTGDTWDEPEAIECWS